MRKVSERRPWLNRREEWGGKVEIKERWKVRRSVKNEDLLKAKFTMDAISPPDGWMT
jgi:hypothetical protein